MTLWFLCVGFLHFSPHPVSPDLADNPYTDVARQRGDGVAAFMPQPGAAAEGEFERVPSGRENEQTVYDLAGRVTDTYDELRRRTRVTYFADGTPNAGRRQQSVQVLSTGNLVTSYQYDSSGNVRFVTDPRGNTVETQYDAHGRPTTVNYPATDEHPATQTTTTYNVLGQRIATADQEGKITRYRYDALGRLVEVRQYLDQSVGASDAAFAASPSAVGVVSTRYTYDEVGNQLTQTDARDHTTSYRYDSVGRRTQRILPDNATETLQYDGWGNLWKRTDFAGKTTTFAYDVQNRLTTKTADATHPSLIYSHAIARVEYDYDDNGARVVAQTFNSGNTLLYAETAPRDERGRMESKSTPLGTLSYEYYANGQLKDVVSSNAGGVSTGYRYDEANRLAFVDDASGVQPVGTPVRTTAYTYNANGSTESVTAANGIRHGYVYDSLNRLRSLSVSNLQSQILKSYTYALNPSGHRKKITESTGRVTDYVYDSLYRLTSETVAGVGDPGQNGAVGYTLDKVGNRQSRASTLGAVASGSNTFNSRDWLSGDAYDANGNTTLSSTVTTQDVYDFEDRLILRRKPDGSSINLGYNADGIRIQKTIFNSSAVLVSATGYLVDTNNLTGYAQVVEEYANAASGVTEKVFTYGSDLISQSVLAPSASLSALSYFQYDGLGSVRGLTNASGAITDVYDYDAFGILVASQTLDPGTQTLIPISASAAAQRNAYLYRGEQFDADLGQYYLRARFYNQSTGRFWNQDTYEGSSSDPMSLHKYLYANANPVMGWDPSGQNTISLPGITMTVGVVGILSKLVVVSLVATLAELPFRNWTIWEGAETTSLHAYFVARHRDGRTYRYDISASTRTAYLAPRNPFKHYEAEMVEKQLPASEALTGLRLPVGRLSEITYRFWDSQIPRGSVDYVWAYKNCFTYSTLYAAKAALLTLLPF